MKEKDIVKWEDIPEEECDVCYLHENAYKILKEEYLCPRCNAPLIKGGLGYGEGFVVVGETNFYNEDQNIGMYELYHCKKCGDGLGNIYVTMPIPVIYNGNHDIFYTGGKNYLVDSTKIIDEKIKEKLLPTIEQYTRRIKDGERSIDSWNLLIWLTGDIHNIIAGFLYENGYKK